MVNYNVVKLIHWRKINEKDERDKNQLFYSGT